MNWFIIYRPYNLQVKFYRFNLNPTKISAGLMLKKAEKPSSSNDGLYCPLHSCKKLGRSFEPFWRKSQISSHRRRTNGRTKLRTDRGKFTVGWSKKRKSHTSWHIVLILQNYACPETILHSRLHIITRKTHIKVRPDPIISFAKNGTSGQREVSYRWHPPVNMTH